ncbi:DUF1642 domain-containing protein [Lactococcus hircilactis]|uniref:DUF1642 domain-containing protein n=1 Tax=Lactococcus hircilactis TaxID=1494462 RepID=UPI003FA1F1B4
MSEFEEELSNLKVSKSENDTEYYNKDQLLTVFKDWQPQQALPVVPEFVAGGIALDEQIDNSIAETLKNIFTCGDRDLKEAGLWIKNNPEKYIIARNIGYTVEKPQLFYLRDELTGQFLAKDNQFKDRDRYFFWTGEDPLTHSIGTAWKLTFTKQEIDSMETGSYEQIEVVE